MKKVMKGKQFSDAHEEEKKKTTEALKSIKKRNFKKNVLKHRKKCILSRGENFEGG